MDVGNIVLNFLLITLLGLFIAFNPALIFINLVLVLKSKKPVRDSLVLATGVALPWIIVVAAAAIWLEPESTLHLKGSIPDFKVPAIIEIIFGLALLGFASKRRLRPADPSENKDMTEKAKRIIVSPGSIFSFAFIRSSLSLTNLLAILFVTDKLVESHATPVVMVVAIAYIIAIGLAPLLAQPYLYSRRPGSLESAKSLLDHILQKGTVLINFILTLTGLVFLIHGLIKTRGN